MLVQDTWLRLANEICFFPKSVDRERELPVHCECELPVERELLFCIQFRVQDTGLVLIIGFCYIRKCTIYFSRPKCVKSGVFRPKIGVRSFAYISGVTPPKSEWLAFPCQRQTKELTIQDVLVLGRLVIFYQLMLIMVYIYLYKWLKTIVIYLLFASLFMTFRFQNIALDFALFYINIYM